MVTLLEVMITSQVTITSQEVIVTSPINKQMVEAIELVVQGRIRTQDLQITSLMPYPLHHKG